MENKDSKELNDKIRREKINKPVAKYEKRDLQNENTLKKKTGIEQLEQMKARKNREGIFRPQFDEDEYLEDSKSDNTHKVSKKENNKKDINKNINKSIGENTHNKNSKYKNEKQNKDYIRNKEKIKDKDKYKDKYSDIENKKNNENIKEIIEKKDIDNIRHKDKNNNINKDRNKSGNKDSNKESNKESNKDSNKDSNKTKRKKEIKITNDEKKKDNVILQEDTEKIKSNVSDISEVERVRKERQKREKELKRRERKEALESRLKELNYKRIAIIASISGIILVLGIVMSLTMIKTTIIDEGSNYSKQEVENMVIDGLMDHNSIYLFLKYRYTEQEKIPFIEYIDVSWVNATTVKIKVYDKIIIGCTNYMNEYLYFDKDGLVIETSSKKQEAIPYITGLNFSEVSLNNKIKVNNEDIFNIILAVTQQITKYKLDIREINFDKNYNMTMYSGDITILLGKKETYDEQLAKLQNMLEQAKKKNLKGILHMENYVEGQNRIIFNKID